MRKTSKAQDGHFPRAVGLILVILGMATGLQSVYFQYRAEQNAQEGRRIAECQYRVNGILIDVLEGRTGSADEATQKLVTMLKAIRDAKAGPEVRAAIDNYISAAEAQKAQRDANPYPTIPNNCRP